MYEIVVLIIALFLSAVGVSAIIGRLWLFLLKPKNKAKTKLVVLLDDDDYDSQIGFEFEKYKWYGKTLADEIVFVCRNDPPTALLYICNTFENINFIKDND